jgi:hypothetical protein
VDEWGFTAQEIAEMAGMATNDDAPDTSPAAPAVGDDKPAEPPAPTPTPDAGASLTVRYNHQDVTVAPEEVAGLVQMGLAHRDTRAQLEAQKAELANHPVLTQVSEMAKNFGLEPEVFLDQLQANQIATQLVGQGVDQEVAAQRAQLQVEQTRAAAATQREAAAAAAREQETRARADAARVELQKFSAAHPEAMQDFPGTLKALKSYMERGLGLTEAYAAQQNDHLSAQVKTLTEKLTAKETAGKAAAASTGPRSGVGGTTPRDPDFAGWEE